MNPTDLFIRQLESLRPEIDHAVRSGKRVRVKLYCADKVAPAQFQSYVGQSEPIGVTVPSS